MCRTSRCPACTTTSKPSSSRRDRSGSRTRGAVDIEDHPLLHPHAVAGSQAPRPATVVATAVSDCDGVLAGPGLAGVGELDHLLKGDFLRPPGMRSGVDD